MVVCKINTSKRPVDLEWPRLTSLCIDMASIVKAECHIAVLLDLEDNNVVA